jgi:hypothetical protein
VCGWVSVVARECKGEWEWEGQVAALCDCDVVCDAIVTW